MASSDRHSCKLGWGCCQTSCVRAVWSLVRGLPPGETWESAWEPLLNSGLLSWAMLQICLVPDPVTRIHGLTSDLPCLCGLVRQLLDWGQPWLESLDLLCFLAHVLWACSLVGEGTALPALLLPSAPCRAALSCCSDTLHLAKLWVRYAGHPYLVLIKPLQRHIPQCIFGMHQRG